MLPIQNFDGGTGGAPTATVNTPPPNSGVGVNSGMGKQVADKISQARQQYPGNDDGILQAFIRDNPKLPIVSKLQGFVSNDRAMRHNNPTAMTTDVAKSLGLKEGVDYTQGDEFGGGLHTAKLNGDPIESTIKAFDSAASKGTPIFTTGSGKPRWSYINMTNDQWKGLTPQQKAETVAHMKTSGEGSKGFSPTQILNSLVQDNQSFTGNGQEVNTSGEPMAGTGVMPKDFGGNPFVNALKQTGEQLGSDVTGLGKSVAASVDSASKLSQGLMSKLVPGGAQVASLPQKITTPTPSQQPGFVGGLIGQVAGGAGLAAEAGGTSVPALAKGLISSLTPEAGGILSKLVKGGAKAAEVYGVYQLLKHSPLKGLLSGAAKILE